MVMVDWLCVNTGGHSTSEEDNENTSYDLSCWSKEYEFSMSRGSGVTLGK